MNLTPGQRLESGERSIYQVEGRAFQVVRNVYYRARKVFWNYRDRDKALYEAAADEWLDVLVRVPYELDFVEEADPRDRHDPDALDAEARRRELEFEQEALARLGGVPWFLEPIDRIDLSVETLAGPATVPAPVLPDPHGVLLAPGGGLVPLTRLIRLCREVLQMVEFLHGQNLAHRWIAGPKLLIDPSGRWFDLATDSLARSDRSDVGWPNGTAWRMNWAMFCRPIVVRCLGRDELPKLFTPYPLEAVRAFARALPADPPAVPLPDRAREEFAWLIGALRRLADSPHSPADLLEGRSRVSDLFGPIRRLFGRS
jgi:hypothetical protein